MVKEDLKTIHQPSTKFQYLAALVVNMLSMGYGVTCGWASPNIELLKSEDSPLPSGPISMEEASWIASLLAIGSLFGTFVFSFISNNYGRKISLLLLTIPTVIGWLLILFAQNVYYLYAARLCGGFVGGGIFIVIPIFLSEIACAHIRGLLGSTFVLTINSGILMAFIFGTFLDYYFPPIIVIVLTAVCSILLFILLPETPSFLLKKNKLSEAEKSIKFYKNLSDSKRDCELLESEVDRLKSTLCNDTSEDSFKLSDITTNPGRKAMLIGIVVVLVNQFSGCFAMLNYTASIFKEAGSSMSPNMSAIVVGSLQLLGSYVATNLVDRGGRKILFAISTIGIALGLIALGVYMMLKTSGVQVETFNWIPIASFSFTIFIANFAVLSLSFLVISEVMPEKLKAFGTSVCLVLFWLSCFIAIKYLPLLTEILGFHGAMYLFAGVCLSSAAFIITSMPETKGRNYNEIMRLLS